MNGARVAGRHYIHYDPDRTDYSVSTVELSRLEATGSNLWKDVCLVCAPLGISCLINALADTKKPFELTLSLFLNYLFGVLGIVLAIVFGIAWRRSYAGFHQILNDIKNKPKMQISLPETVNVGSLPAVAIEPAAEIPQMPPAGGSSAG